MNENPYEANDLPTVGSANESQTAGEPILSIARNVFLAWEKLRIGYVMILTLITLSLIAVGGFPNWTLLLVIIEGAVFANIAYFAGPALETYIRWLGYDKSWPRWLMFSLGTLFSIGLTFGVLAVELFPNQQ